MITKALKKSQKTKTPRPSPYPLRTKFQTLKKATSQKDF